SLAAPILMIVGASRPLIGLIATRHLRSAPASRDISGQWDWPGVTRAARSATVGRCGDRWLGRQPATADRDGARDPGGASGRCPGAAWDPGPPGAWDPSRPGAWDPGRPGAWDPSRPAAWDPSRPAAWDPSRPAAWDPCPHAASAPCSDPCRCAAAGP